MDPEPTPYERLGGADVLRRVIERFVDRVFDDLMIGFHFRKASRARVKRFEEQHAAVHLGAPGATYEGAPLRVAHDPHPITGGQFHRRMQILREVLEEEGAPADVIEHWMAVTESLRAEITAEPGSACLHGGCKDRAP